MDVALGISFADTVCGSTMIYTHVLKVAAGGTSSPLDALAPPPVCKEPEAAYA